MSTHFVVTSLLLLPALLPDPWTGACLVVNLLYGITFHQLHFSIKPPPGFPATPAVSKAAAGT